MSHSVKDPKNVPNPNALSADVDTLTSEYKKLDSMLAAINQNIQDENEKVATAQQAIAANRTQGLQVVGQANVISRILLDMGVDAQTLATPPMPEPVEPAPPIEAVPEFEEEAPAKPSLRNRFSSR
jgi:hypothetical protein